MIEQGSPEWHAMRLAKATGSRMPDVLAKTKSGPAASRVNYKKQLVLERIFSKPMGNTFVTAAMQEGTAREPDARAAYEFVRGVTVEQVSFVDHPEILWSGCSPDGLVGADGLIEIKCPQHPAHYDSVIAQAPPSRYMPQILWALACMPERKWLDFVSYHPEFEDDALVIARVRREDVSKDIAALEQEVRIFLAEVASEVENFLKRKERRAA